MSTRKKKNTSPASTPAKKAKKTNYVYTKNHKGYTCEDIAALDADAIAGLADRQCNCKFYVAPQYKDTQFKNESVKIKV